MKLNAQELTSLPSGKLHHDGDGLYLQVLGDSRSWILRYTQHGRTRKIGLGGLKNVSLAEARSKARAFKAALSDGADPRFLSRRGGAPLFGEYAAQVGARVCQGLKTQRSKNKWTKILPRYAKAIWDKPVDRIDVTDIRVVLEPIWVKKPRLARDIRQKINSVMVSAIAEKHRHDANPATAGVAKHLQLGKQRAVKHFNSLPYAELPAFMVELAKNEAVTARMLEILILTCARTCELRGMRWDELQLAEGLWIVPAERMKMGKEWFVPLTPYVVKLIEAVPRLNDSPFVFPSPSDPEKPYCEPAMITYLHRALRKDITVHGFRSTFRNWAGEETDYHHNVIEHCLAHIEGSQSTKAYWTGQMLRRRRQLLERWAEYALSQIPQYRGFKLRLVAAE